MSDAPSRAEPVPDEPIPSEAIGSGTTTVRRTVRALPDPPSPLAALTAFAGARRPVLLESAGGAPDADAWLFVDPLATLDRVRDLDGLRRALERFRFAGDRPGGPFRGGFVGALAYDLGVAGEVLDLPADPWGWPPVLGGVYGDWVHWDRVRGTAELVTVAAPGRPDRGAELAQRLARAPRSGDEHGGDARLEPTLPPTRTRSADEHVAAVEAARAAIAAGDYYQANLSHRLVGEVAGSALDLYRALRRANPAPYMALLDSEHGAICSSSPELLLDFDGARAVSRPIKGTAPRGSDPESDRAAADALVASAKDRAELAMIVDLVRNDLGRVAVPGGVSVDALAALESQPFVHHLVATVSARVRAGTDALDLLAALFPGGSITGAPKLAAMRAIAALEGEGRGPFTGSLGWISCDGAARFNILIRTLLARPAAGGRTAVSFRVGGGITWHSDARAEDAETMDKARGLVRALGAREPVDA